VLDGHVLVDAHVHVPHLSTLSSAWVEWAERFGAPGVLDRVWRPDGAPDPARLDELFAAEGVDVALLFCEYSPKATGYQRSRTCCRWSSTIRAGSGRWRTSTRTCTTRSPASSSASSTSARRR
jgi:hypothetical protein